MYAVELIMNITCLQVSTRINHLLLLTGIVAEMQLKPEISQNRLYKLCFLTADIWGRFAFPMSACPLIPLMLFRKCNGLQSPWLLPVLQTWLCRLGWEVVLLVPRADIPQPIRTMSPWEKHVHCLGDPFAKVALAAQVCMNQKIWFFLVIHIWLPWLPENISSKMQLDRIIDIFWGMPTGNNRDLSATNCSRLQKK